MARLTVANLLDEILDEIPGVVQAKVTRAANKVIQRIHNETNVMDTATFTTRAATTSGTVTVTQDSTTVAFSGTPLASTDPFMLFQATGDDTWFVLTYVSTSSGTLSSKWAEATAAGSAYTIVYPTVSFPQAVGSVHRIWKSGLPDLEYVADRGDEGFGRLGFAGRPTQWMYHGHDTTTASPNDELLRIQLRPAPETRDVFNYTYSKRPSLLDVAGATSQVVPLQDHWNEVVIAGTMCFCWSGRDNPDRASYWLNEYERGITRVRGQVNKAGIVTPRPIGMLRRATMYQPLPEEM